MARNKRLIPDGMEPVEWGSAVWQAMDDFGFSQDEAKRYVASKAQIQPPKNKMVESSTNK